MRRHHEGAWARVGAAGRAAGRGRRICRMVQEEYREMIKVAFALQEDESWMGGINYLKNLLYAVSGFGDRIEPVLFVGKRSAARTVRLFEPYAAIFRHGMFDKK